MFGRSRSVSGQLAIVTGGASGIGFALAHELATAGARVVIVDIDDAEVASAATRLNEPTPPIPVVGRQLDVCDRVAVQSLVDDLAGRHGAIDLLFNNAGISMGGPTHELTGQHWDRIVDINVRAVINGVLAVYPRMVQQGHGHIVNTASGAGLVAPPLVVPYATSKHAVVGLSNGLRPEAALHGVRVSVLCPGAVETAILDRPPPDDLPPTPSAPVTARTYLRRVRQKPMPADRFAIAALRHVRRNTGIIVVPRSSKALWYLYRLWPPAVDRVCRTMARIVVRDLVKPRGEPNS